MSEYTLKDWMESPDKYYIKTTGQGESQQCTVKKRDFFTGLDCLMHSSDYKLQKICGYFQTEQGKAQITSQCGKESASFEDIFRKKIDSHNRKNEEHNNWIKKLPSLIQGIFHERAIIQLERIFHERTIIRLEIVDPDDPIMKLNAFIEDGQLDINNNDHRRRISSKIDEYLKNIENKTTKEQLLSVRRQFTNKIEIENNQKEIPGKTIEEEQKIAPQEDVLVQPTSPSIEPLATSDQQKYTEEQIGRFENFFRILFEKSGLDVPDKEALSQMIATVSSAKTQYNTYFSFSIHSNKNIESKINKFFNIGKNEAFGEKRVGSSVVEVSHGTTRDSEQVETSSTRICIRGNKEGILEHFGLDKEYFNWL